MHHRLNLLVELGLQFTLLLNIEDRLPSEFLVPLEQPWNALEDGVQVTKHLLGELVINPTRGNEGLVYSPPFTRNTGCQYCRKIKAGITGKTHVSGRSG